MLSVRLECDAQLRLDNFREQITQKIGEPLDREKVAASLKNLFATGRFTQLSADAEANDAGVVLVFRGRATFFVGVVAVEGTPKSLDERQLSSATRLRLGQPLVEGELWAAEQRVGTVLSENGYHQAQVSSSSETYPETQVADVTFRVVPGAAARLREVSFDGQFEESPKRLTDLAGWKLGKHITSARLERGLMRIQRYYARKGWLQASVGVRERAYDPQRNTETLTLHIDPGSLVRVNIQGAALSGSKQRALIPVFHEGIVDEGSVERGRQNLENYFRRRGHHAGKVEVEQKVVSGSSLLEITYTVTLGKPSKFVGYAFEGHRAVPEDELARAMTIEPKDFLHRRGIFNDEMLARDVGALEAIYEARGFLNAQITPRINDAHRGKAGQWFVTFDIEEGPESRVGQLRLLGLSPDLESGVRPLLASKPGAPYAPTRVAGDRETILDYLSNHGYSRASAEAKTSPSSAPQEFDVEFQVDPGQQETIERVVLVGNEYTRPGIIRRELKFRPGEPLKQAATLESQRRLYDLGTFSQVQIAPQEPAGTETRKTVLVNVEEARRWTLGYGGGIEFQRLSSDDPQGVLKASPRLSFELSRLNVGGRAQIFTLRGRLSTLEKVGAVSYLVPRFPTRRDLSLRLSALFDRSQDVLTFTAERQEASASLEKRWSQAALLVGRFSFRRVLVDSESLKGRIDERDILRFSRPARVSMFSVSYANDHRDDPTDATRGSYSLAEAGASWRRLGSESNFLRLSGQNATYYRLGPHVIFARNTRLAIESTVGPVAGQEQQIPLPERVFMGGSESHRGFSINQAGPRDGLTGFPVGGNALFLNTLELRVPFAENRLGFALFHDAGNVYSSVRRMKLLKVSQNTFDVNEDFSPDLDYTSHAIGLGVRYQTPVGPVRFDFGYNLNPARFRVVNLDGTRETRRLSHFQFFLSIGQSF